jgi:DNA polymerase III subunit delta
VPQLSPDELVARLGKGKPIPALLLLGEETFLRDACRAALVEAYVPEAARTWAVSRYTAGRGETQAALEQAQTLPMLSPQQVIFLEEAQAIEELAEKKREEAVRQLESYLADPAGFTVLVIEAAHLDQRMRLAKVLVEKCVVVRVGLGENQDERHSAAVALAKNLAREQGLTFEQSAAEDLAESVAADLQRLKTEIEKLSTYAGQRKTIRREDVAVLVISEKAATVWELTDLLAGRRQKLALEFLERLLRDGEEPLQILGALAWMYRKLIEASEITNSWQAARSLQMRPEQAELAVRNARQISKPRLLASLRALERADDRLKSGEKDARAVMEFLVSELAVPPPRGNAK